MKTVSIRDYTYELADDRIARYPLPQRDRSKLLVYRQGQIEHTAFNLVGEHLPPGSILFLNDTKVIPARLFFAKQSGAKIEGLLLVAIARSRAIAHVMGSRGSCTWRCTTGNLGRRT